MSATSLKERIHAGEIVIGFTAAPTTTRSELESILSHDDYAFVSVDSQHGPFNEERLVEFCAITADLGLHTQFRIKHTRHTYLVGNLLDLGPTGVEIPQVEDEATVQEAIDYFYYPQQGKRSWGGSARWGIKGHPDRLDYAAWWNKTGVLWIQIESIEAVTQARQLAKPGVDCLSWGPADLSFNRERHASHPFQSDDDCVRYVVRQLEDTGVHLCYRNYTSELRNKYIDMGVTVLLERPKS